MSKSKFIHTLLEYKNIFALEQEATVLSFFKTVAFLLRHPVFGANHGVIEGWHLKL